MIELNLNKIKELVRNPYLIKIENKTAKDKLLTPYVDELNHKLTYYKGFLKYPKRLENYKKSLNYKENKIVNFLPTIMDLEPNSSCNYKCIMCQVSEWGGKRDNDMSFSEYKEFIDNNENNLVEIKLHGMGEPFLHPKYTEFVKYASDKYIWTRTSTNGSLLDKNESYKKIIDAEIGEIQCSFDGATKEIYEQIRKGGNFEKVVNNFTLLNKYANTKNRLYTRMWVVINKLNRHQLYDFIQIADKMGFRRVSFSISLNDWGSDSWKEKNNEIEAHRLNQEEHLKLIELSKKYNIDITLWEQKNSYNKNNLCPWIFKRPYISCEFKIVPCCMISNPDVVTLGNAKNLESEWNNEKYQEFRKAHLEGNIPKICRGCYQ